MFCCGAPCALKTVRSKRAISFVMSKQAKQGSMKRVIQSDEEIVEKRLCEYRAKSGEEKSVGFHNCTFMIKGLFKCRLYVFLKQPNENILT